MRIEGTYNIQVTATKDLENIPSVLYISTRTYQYKNTRKTKLRDIPKQLKTKI